MDRPPAQAPTQLPPGFRFHPTDEELVLFYLRQKALARPLPAAVIPVVNDVARLDPWDLPGASEGEGYFFSLRRSPAAGRGSRRRRAASGYWKATGKERPVFLQCGGGRRQLLLGVKTALAFHRSEPPPPSSSSRTDWIMHEYRLAVPHGVAEQWKKNASHGCVAEPGDWVVCRVFLKNSHRSGSSTNRDGSSKALGHRASAGPPLQPPLLFSAPPSSSSSSCVTGVTGCLSDEDEVSSGSATRDGGPSCLSKRGLGI